MSIDIYVKTKDLFDQPQLKVEATMPGTEVDVYRELENDDPDYGQIEFYLTTELQVTIPGYPYSRAANVIEDGQFIHFVAGSNSAFADFMDHWAKARGVSMVKAGPSYG